MTKTGNILIIDDEEDILLSLRLFLRQHFEKVDTENNPNLIPRRLRNPTRPEHPDRRTRPTRITEELVETAG